MNEKEQLYRFILKRDLENIMLTVEKGIDINSQLDYGFCYGGEGPALHIVAHFGFPDIASFLIEKGAQVNLKDSRGWTPMCWAAESGHIEMVNLLLAKGADVNAGIQHDTPLHRAAFKGHLEIVNLLLDRGAQVEAKDKFGDTPLVSAVVKGHVDIVKVLINRGADVNVRTGWNNPLKLAVELGDDNIITLLKQHGAAWPE